MQIFFSETRAYMALVMGTTMSVIMLAFMLKMHPNRKMNLGIFGGSVAVFALALWLVRKLADGIIEAQHREIGEMKGLIKDLESKK